MGQMGGGVEGGGGGRYRGTTSTAGTVGTEGILTSLTVYYLYISEVLSAVKRHNLLQFASLLATLTSRINYLQQARDLLCC